MSNYLIKSMAIAALVLAITSCVDSSSPNSAVPDWSSPAGENSVSPNLSLDINGLPILSWLKVSSDSVALEYSRWELDGWGLPIMVANGQDWLVNRADFPSVVQLNESLWAAHWLVMTDPAVFAYDVLVSLSRDGGVTWEPPFKPHTDGTLSEHGFVSFFTEGDDVGIVWLDGREMEAGHGHKEMSEPNQGELKGMTIRSTKVTADGSIFQDQIIDNLVCDCCQTDIAQSNQGPILVFRNRTENERRDIYYSRMTNGRWSESQPVAIDDWNIAGCPVNGPSVAVNGQTTAVAWYTKAKGYGEVKLALSKTGDGLFGTALAVESGDTVLGQVGLSSAQDGGFLVSWMTYTEGTVGHLKLRYFDAEGIAGPTIITEEIDFTRKAGLPQMVLLGDLAVLSWTGGGETEKKIIVATAQIGTTQTP